MRLQKHKVIKAVQEAHNPEKYKMNPHLESRLEAIKQSLMAAYAGGVMMPSASKGSEREIFLRKFLEQIFPRPYRFGSGAITDLYGQISGQLDIVVETAFEPSFPLPNSDGRLYLAESVGAVIEVKSNLSSQWSEVEDSANKVGQLRRNLEVPPFIAKPPSPQIPFTVVAYTGYKTVNGLVNRLLATEPSRRPASALVIESCIYVQPPLFYVTGISALLCFIHALSSEMGRFAFSVPGAVRYTGEETYEQIKKFSGG